MWESVQAFVMPLHALLAALKNRDVYTAEHSNRTMALAGALGARCKLSEHELDLLRVAATAHDLGKIGIPDSVLLKPGRLDADEWTVMKTHAEIGASMLAAIPLDEMEDVVSAVRHHHEGYDGKGYPNGLAGEAIPYMSRIITLADGYDAMAVSRPYHKPRAHAAIMDVMHGENARHYDPWLLDQFTKLIETSEYHADRFAGDRHST